MTLQHLHIGFDDTDSLRRGCTTYIAALLVERLEKLGAVFIDYPNLIRLNPNVPWKTRGNGALCLRIKCDRGIIDEVKELVLSVIEENSDLTFQGTDPGVVFFTRARIPREIQTFAKNAITGIVSLKTALKLIRQFKAEAVGFKSGRGIVGGLAAIGETLMGDHTYEIIAYRKPENYGKERRIDKNSIIEMDKATAPYTFNNIDYETGRVLITPRGPDPVLFGIRGENPEVVKEAFKMVKPLEPIERWVIFRTNHGTDAHLKYVMKLDQLKPFHPVIARGIVMANPKIIPGRHVIFTISDQSASIDCAAYAPTGMLRKVVSKLIVGDYVEVYGGVRPASPKHPLTINLEKLRILRLAPKVIYQNPVCHQCGKRLKSMGKGKGFRCEKCGSRYPKLGRIAIKIKRDLSENLYIVPPRSQRHLTKPPIRYGMEKRRPIEVRLLREWHYP